MPSYWGGGSIKDLWGVLVSTLLVPTHVCLTVELQWKRSHLLVVKQSKFIKREQNIVHPQLVPWQHGT